MSTHEKETFFATYNWAKNWEDLPWSHSEPTLFLAEICRRRPPGQALDIGCGAGTDSLFLAEQGWEVTSLDFMPKALEYTQARATAAGLRVTAVEADISQWQPPHSYDLVLDHGLLHNMDRVRHAAYRAAVLAAVGSSGDFVLLHWHPRYPGQPDGRQGPHRIPREEIKAFFAPELQERYFACEDFEDLTSVVGGGMVQAYYWLRPNQSWHDAVGLLSQIKATLAANGIEWQAALAVTAQSDMSASDELLCTVLGPGRLGVHHIHPDVALLPEIVSRLAARAGCEPEQLDRLLRLFASVEHANICVADARCGVCQVSYCKRLRFR